MLRRKQARQAAPAAAPDTAPAGTELGTRFKMRERIFAIGDDFWIEDARGQRVFKVG